MKVTYIHTFEITVEDSAEFNETASLDSICGDAERSASVHTPMIKKGGLDPRPVRSKRTTKHVIVMEKE
jgi:hypothetical protein